ncbi:hypothetical protein M9Y10_030869 [Tritrichomonas musculus]|uniref:DUF3447 domain-containing protein n=1 Tax=Tritrichomonas musculus TaxID=1915356 RepID=A0ABR2H275_9EUKA
MEIENYLNKMKEIQNTFLKYVENEESTNDQYNKLIKIFDDEKIANNQHKLKSVLYLLLNVSNYHHRGPNFFDKIFKIILVFRDSIKKYYSNYETFNIFKSNNKILLFLVEEKIITIDESVANTIKNTANKVKYFWPEMKQYYDEKTAKKISKEIPKDIEEKRKIGENDDLLCELIRKDSLDEFIALIEKANLDLKTKIKPSFLETNSFLIDKEPSLIEYASFFGSMQIFKFLNSKRIELTPSLWQYSIHSQNSELLQFLKDNQIHPDDENFDKFLKESIKCHHIEFTHFIKNSFYQNNEEKCFEIFIKSFKYYNFEFIRKESINEAAFFDLCHYDYFFIVELLMQQTKIDVNAIRILKQFFNSINDSNFLITFQNYII